MANNDRTPPRNTTLGTPPPPPPAAGDEGGIPPEELDQGARDEGATPPAAPQARGDGRARSRTAPSRDRDEGEEPVAPVDPHANAPKAPPGYAVLFNGSEDTVTVTLMDGDNQPRRTKVKPGRYEVFPIAYVKVAISRAPQLKEINRTASEPEDDED